MSARLSPEDRSRMKTLLDEYDVNLKNVFSNQHKLSTKKNIMDMAKEFPTYFARLYPVSPATTGGGGHKDSSGSQHQRESSGGDAQYLAVSHSGVRLVRREKSLPTDYLQVGKRLISQLTRINVSATEKLGFYIMST